MVRDLVIAITLVSFGVPAFCAEIPDAEQTRADFESLAAELPYLCLSSVIYDRPDPHFRKADPRRPVEYSRVLGKVTSRIYAKEALLALLGHGDAKVRTLAAVALFDREDPTILPALVELCDDNFATFDGHFLISAVTGPGLPESGPRPKKQTVGDVATKMVSFYMARSGFYHGIMHNTQPPGFTEYWRARRDRSHCAAWFAVQLARASQGVNPTQENCSPRIRRLRKQIDKLPPEEQTWILLWLNGESGSDVLVTEEELVEACNSIGPDKLLLMLQKKIPSDDPDLQPRPNNNRPYKRMQLFVLRHADQVFRRGDSDALLACERWERDYQKHGISDPTITPWWAVAAARLKSANASRILHPAIDRFQGKYDSDERATLCAAMWQLCGKSEMKFIVNWFFDESPERGSSLNCRGLFIEAMRKETKGREVIVELIKDKRLDDLEWQSLECLVRAVNAWTGTSIVTEEEIRKVWHPLGKTHYPWGKGKARKDYPKETEELQVHLSDWRKRLRMSVPTILDQSKNKERVEQDAALDANKL